MSHDNPRQDNGGRNFIDVDNLTEDPKNPRHKSPVPLDISREITPDWTHIWTGKGSEDELNNFQFKGPGWYLTGIDVMLVIPTGAMHPESPALQPFNQPWAQVWDEDQLFRFMIWNGRSPVEAFNSIINAPTRVDTRGERELIDEESLKGAETHIREDGGERQCLGVYVNNDEEAKEFLDLLRALKNDDVCVGNKFDYHLPDLDWDRFEPSSSQDEAWRRALNQALSDQVEEKSSEELCPHGTTKDEPCEDCNPRAFDDTELQRQIKAAQIPKGDFSVTLVQVGPMKIPIIKVLRDELSIGLKEAKGLTELPLPYVILEGVSRSKAKSLRLKLNQAGARATTQLVGRPRFQKEK